MSSPSSREEAVLGEVLVNDNLLQSGLRQGEQDDDYALAKMLQEQERAFLMLNSGRAAENYPPEAGPSGAAAGDGEEAAAEEEEELDDEALARRLQEEEEAEHYRRMLAMAGMVPGEGEEEEEEFEDDPVDPDTMTYEELTALGEAVGTVSRGMSAEQIAGLPVRRYVDVATAACADEQCAVCRLEYGAEDEVRVLPCSHYYHPECVGEWLRHNKVCPVCSKEVAAKPGGGGGAQ